MPSKKGTKQPKTHPSGYGAIQHYTDDQGNVLPPGPPPQRVVKQRKAAYLEWLTKLEGDIPAALRESKVKIHSVARYRLSDFQFAVKEREILGKCPTKGAQLSYLIFLDKCMGNEVKARRMALVDRSIHRVWRQDANFKAREDEVFESIVAEANEQNVRLMTGRKPRPEVDAQQLRWGLPKIDPRWKDDPKRVEHSYAGGVDSKSINERILALLGSSEE